METNEQTTNTQNGNRLVGREQADSSAMGGRLEVERLSKKGERTHGHGHQCGDCSGEGVEG